MRRKFIRNGGKAKFSSATNLCRTQSICSSCDIHRAFRPNDKMRTRDFLLHRHLRGDALLNFFRHPAAFQKASVAVRAEHATQMILSNCDSACVSKSSGMTTTANLQFSSAPGFDLREPAFADARVQNGFELLARRLRRQK